jgi:hypothetical protein
MPETDRDGFVGQLLAWFKTGRGVPSFHTDEVIETAAIEGMGLTTEGCGRIIRVAIHDNRRRSRCTNWRST